MDSSDPLSAMTDYEWAKVFFFSGQDTRAMMRKNVDTLLFPVENEEDLFYFFINGQVNRLSLFWRWKFFLLKKSLTFIQSAIFVSPTIFAQWWKSSKYLLTFLAKFKQGGRERGLSENKTKIVYIVWCVCV